MKITPVDWILLKLAMTRKNRELELMIDDHLNERCFDFLQQLKHDVDICPDPRSFYEKEIPYRMERMATTDLRQITEKISNGYANNLYWLQTKLRSLGITKFEIPFSEHSLKSGDYTPQSLDLLDIHKARLYTRAGTLITALCLSGISIGVFAGSLLFGAGAEEVLCSQSKKSKEKIICVLPNIVNNYKAQMRLHIVEAISKPCSILINTINNIDYEHTN